MKAMPDEIIPEEEVASVEETVRQMRLKRHGPDAYFARGVLYANAGDYERACAAYDEALRLAPDDGEIYQHRAERGSPWDASAKPLPTPMLRFAWTPAISMRVALARRPISNLASTAKRWKTPRP